MSLTRFIEWLGGVLPGGKHVETGPISLRRGVVWSIRYTRFRNRVLPYRAHVPEQPDEPDAPYTIWRWRGRDLFRRPWSGL